MIKVGLEVLALSSFAAAADNAVLKNGFAIRHEHRAVNGQTTRLFLTSGNDSFVDVLSANIDKFEALLPDPKPVVVPKPGIAKPDLKALVKDASAKTLIDEDFIHSVIRAESAAKARALSPKGARGLMQLMPATARELGVADAFDETQNVHGGTRYLKALLERYNGDAIKALAAYNAGASRVDKYKGVPPYRETRAYVAKIIRDFNARKLAKKTAGD
jgi:soluble lytic murein transglycosylase-like protein